MAEVANWLAVVTNTHYYLLPSKCKACKIYA